MALGTWGLLWGRVPFTDPWCEMHAVISGEAFSGEILPSDCLEWLDAGVEQIVLGKYSNSALLRAVFLWPPPHCADSALPGTLEEPP